MWSPLLLLFPFFVRNVGINITCCPLNSFIYIYFKICRVTLAGSLVMMLCKHCSMILVSIFCCYVEISFGFRRAKVTCKCEDRQFHRFGLTSWHVLLLLTRVWLGIKWDYGVEKAFYVRWEEFSWFSTFIICVFFFAYKKWSLVWATAWEVWFWCSD